MIHPNNKIAQDIARRAMEEIKDFIHPGVTEREIRKQVEILLIQHGSSSFWYHGIGALVHVGHARTLVSQGGREYRVGDCAVAQNDVITLDLAPTIDDYWGDFARTIFVENGAVVQREQDVKNEKYAFALTCEKALHSYIMEVARPDMSMEGLYLLANQKLVELGGKNLDYSGNWGHSVPILQQDRVYLEAGSHTKLSECTGFTFEPHVQWKDCDFGIKRENIYYFEGETLKEL